jgi:hypothetical protein
VTPEVAASVQFSANSDHEVAARVAFEPNRALIMANQRAGLHGVAGGQDGVVRRTIMCGYWLLTRQQ